MTSTPPPPPGPQRGAPVGAGAGRRGSGPTGNGHGASRRPEQGQEEWRTAADEGWRAATAAAKPPAETTNAGLPRRVPMAQLVPGGVDKSETSVQRRTPEAVRGLLSAYHRGVQRGRTQPKDEDSTNPEATPAGQRASQGGPTGSGQKEQER
jgi:hypothetical protein